MHSFALTLLCLLTISPVVAKDTGLRGNGHGLSEPDRCRLASHPTWRARSLSVYRFWRDLGYAIGALSAGLIADFFGLASAISSIAALTLIAGAVVSGPR